MRLDHANQDQLRQWEQELAGQHGDLISRNLNLDLTRGKPSAEQLALSNKLDGILGNNYKDSSGTDVRNYGGLDGIEEAKALCASLLEVETNEILVGGNSSLTLMYQSVAFNLLYAEDAWNKSGTVKFLCPTPGYDRHFSVCEQLGIEMIAVPMNDAGPDMDHIEALVKDDASIKGIWCVPRFSNPTGITYSDDVVEGMAKLPSIAGKGFKIFWDNAYAVHDFAEGAGRLSPLMRACHKHNTTDSVYLFGSTSKITFAGAGVAFMGASPKNLSAFKNFIGIQSIGPDKVNQLRHVKFFTDKAGVLAHMQQHAKLLAPKFECVQKHLSELKDTGMGSWTNPKGGYFVSFDSLPGLAKEIIALAAEAGVKLTPAGATFPYGNDPENRNIRLAPSFPKQAEIEQAMEVFVVCVKLASVRAKLKALEAA